MIDQSLSVDEQYAQFMALVDAGLVDDWTTRETPRGTMLHIRGQKVALIRRTPGTTDEWEWEEAGFGDRRSETVLESYTQARDDALMTLGAGDCTVQQWHAWYGQF